MVRTRCCWIRSKSRLQYVFPIPRVCWRPEESSSHCFLPRAPSRRSVPRKSPLNSSRDLGGGRLARLHWGAGKGMASHQHPSKGMLSWGMRPGCWCYGALPKHLRASVSPHAAVALTIYFWCRKRASDTHWEVLGLIVQGLCSLWLHPCSWENSGFGRLTPATSQCVHVMGCSPVSLCGVFGCWSDGCCVLWVPES